MWVSRDNKGNISFHTEKPKHITYGDNKFFFSEGESIFTDENLLKFISYCGFEMENVTYKNSPIEIKIEKVKKNKKKILKMNKLVKVEKIDENKVNVSFKRKKYEGIYDKDYGWNFWELESNDLADEMSSYNGNIYNLEELTEYFENNILI